MDKKETILKLISFFHCYENHFPDVPHYDLARYFDKILEEDKIIIEWEDDEVIGYLMYLRINYAQFGWLVCNNGLDIHKHDINKGNIAYVTNVIVRPKSPGIMNKLQRKFKDSNKDADFITSHRNGKRFKPIAVFKNKGVR